MSLVLHMHPLSSYCHKALIALYELDVPFEAALLDLGDPKARAGYLALWPVGKMPLLEDRDAGIALPEASIIIEYLDARFGGGLIPRDSALALEARLQDRILDLYLHTPMQKIVDDRLRPDDVRDPYGAAEAARHIARAFDMLEQRLEGRAWLVGEAFSLADCAAAPALFYASQRVPIGPDRPLTAAYLQRLKARPSYARALREAEPYFHLVPQ